MLNRVYAANKNHVFMSKYSAIHKAAGVTVPGCSMILTGTIIVEQKSVYLLSIGAASRNGLGGGDGFFVNSAVSCLQSSSRT